MATITITSGRLSHDPIGDTYAATVQLPPIRLSIEGNTLKACMNSIDGFRDIIHAACAKAVADTVIAEWRRLQADEKAKIDRCMAL